MVKQYSSEVKIQVRVLVDAGKKQKTNKIKNTLSLKVEQWSSKPKVMGSSPIGCVYFIILV